LKNEKERMITITSKRVSGTGVGFDIEIEFPTRKFTDSIDFESKEQANKYYESTLKSVLGHNLDALFRMIPNKQSAEYISFWEQYVWFHDMNCDYKTLIDIIKNNSESLLLISRDSDEAKLLAEKIIKFCTT
jgi:hypothetical protein